jgi:hypothetical protein
MVSVMGRVAVAPVFPSPRGSTRLSLGSCACVWCTISTKRLAFGPPKGKNMAARHGVSMAVSMGERHRGLTVVAG